MAGCSDSPALRIREHGWCERCSRNLEWGPENPGPRVTREIFEKLREWARATGLVACTMRFHHLLGQYARYGISDISEEWIRSFPRGETTALELKQGDDMRHRVWGMTKGRRYDLKRARSALDLRISEGTNALDDLKIFRALYRESMERICADEFFFFADEYFDRLAKDLGDKFAVFTALAGDRPVASAILLARGD